MRALAAVAMVAALTLTGCSRAAEFEPSASAAPTPVETTASAEPAASASPSVEPGSSAEPEQTVDPNTPVTIVFKHPGVPAGMAAYIAEQDGPFAGSLVGSGCSPSSTTSLPDGMWRGIVTDYGDTWMDFDLVCSYSFSSPEYDAYFQEWLTADPEEPGYLDKFYAPTYPGYKIVNDNPATRRLTVSSSARGWVAGAHEGRTPWTVTLSGRRLGNEVWVFVNGGLVTEVNEVYYP